MKPVVIGRRKKQTMIVGSLLSVDKSYVLIQLLLKKSLMLHTLTEELGYEKATIHYYIKKLDRAGILIKEIKQHPTRHAVVPYYSVRPFVLSLPFGTKL